MSATLTKRGGGCSILEIAWRYAPGGGYNPHPNPSPGPKSGSNPGPNRNPDSVALTLALIQP